jgi:hypothetical protein
VSMISSSLFMMSCSPDPLPGGTGTQRQCSASRRDATTWKRCSLAHPLGLAKALVADGSLAVRYTQSLHALEKQHSAVAEHPTSSDGICSDWSSSWPGTSKLGSAAAAANG